MNFIEVLKIILKNVQRKKLRSFLTILGIIIGSSIFLSIFNLGKAAEENIFVSLERNLGSNIITILPIQSGRRVGFTTMRNFLFSENEIEKIKKVEGVESVYGVYQTSLPISFRREEYRIAVNGIYNTKDWSKIEIERIGIREGRSIEKSGEAVIGYRVSIEFFKKPLKVGEKISILNRTFRVVGILNEAGGLLSSFDRSIFLSIEDLRKIQNTSKQINYIVVRIKEGYDIEKVGREIHNTLLKLRREEEGKETFTVVTPSFFRNIISETIGLLSVFLLSIAFVSILVGSIGVSNTMFTAVLERTKEIGILKAVGAKNSDILKLFLLESVIICLIGSIIGCIVGIILSFALQILIFQMTSENFQTPFLGRSGIELIIDYRSLFIALFIGLVSGIISGYLPARRASKIEAIEALKYE